MEMGFLADDLDCRLGCSSLNIREDRLFVTLRVHWARTGKFTAVAGFREAGEPQSLQSERLPKTSHFGMTPDTEAWGGGG